MHRAFVISLGRTLDPYLERLQAEYEGRRAEGALPEHLEADFLCAPIEGVGNLSRPIELLRDKLWEDILNRLTELLTFQNDADEFILDIVLVTNFGDKLAVGATQVIVEALLEVVPREFVTIFPPHRRGSNRRWRIIPISLLPSRKDTERDRAECVIDLRTFHDQIETACQEAADGTDDFPVDRLFILDAMSPRGVLTFGDLATQASQFARLLLFSGARTDTNLTQLLEARVHEVGATLGIAGASVNIVGLREKLGQRLARDAVEKLFAEQTPRIPAPQEIIAADSLSDAAAHERAMHEIRAFVVQTLNTDSAACLKPVANRLNQLPDWIAELEYEAKTAQETNASGQRSSGQGLAPIGVSTIGLSGGLFAAAYYAVGWTLAASAALATGFGVFALALLGGMYLWLRRPDDDSDDRKPAQNTAEDPAAQRAEDLKLQVDHVSRQVSNLDASLAALRGHAISKFEPTPSSATETPSSGFELDAGGEELVETIYNLKAGDIAAFVSDVLEAAGGWDELLETPEAFTYPQIHTEASERFCYDPALFRSSEVSPVLAKRFQLLIDTFANGIEPTLEHKSRVQFDPTGLQPVLQNHMVSASAAVESTTFECPAADCSPIDLWLVSATTDIHRDAITIFNQETEK